MHRVLHLAAIGLVAALPIPSDEELPSLADIADHYGTDKSLKFGHAYTNLYGPLLDPRRESVLNVTEIGVLFGSSVLMWADYFPKANIYGIDIILNPQAVSRTKNQSRIHLSQANAHDATMAERLGLANESMDIVLEDASHSREGTHLIAAALWRLVKPGGFYIIEDVNVGGNENGKYTPGAQHTMDAPGFSSVAHNASEVLRDIYLNNDVFFADTMLGVDPQHNAFAHDQAKKRWMRDVVNHNWHVVVIRKRPVSRRAAHGHANGMHGHGRADADSRR